MTTSTKLRTALKHDALRYRIMNANTSNSTMRLPIQLLLINSYTFTLNMNKTNSLRIKPLQKRTIKTCSTLDQKRSWRDQKTLKNRKYTAKYTVHLVFLISRNILKIWKVWSLLIGRDPFSRVRFPGSIFVCLIKCFPSTLKRKVGAFKKLRFHDRLVWTEGLTREIKLRF